jgi:hypothetical protein
MPAAMRVRSADPCLAASGFGLSSMMENAPMLQAAWRGLSGEVVTLMRLHPGLMQRMTLAPLPAFHSYALYLSLIPPEERMFAKELAAHLHDSDPRALLREALPDADPRLWKMLSRLPLSVLKPESYVRLDRIMRSPVADVALQIAPFDQNTLAFLDELTRLDPMVMLAHRALRQSVRLARVLHSALQILRRLEVLEDDTALRRVMPRLKPDNIDRFLRRRFGRAVLNVPILPSDSNLRAISRLSELFALGYRFKNCLPRRKDLWWGLLTGSYLFFEWCGEEPAAFNIERGPADTYALSEIAGPDNATISEATRSLIRDELLRVGIELQPARFGNLMDHMEEAGFGIATGFDLEFDEL